jgi:hypothetical protein
MVAQLPNPGLQVACGPEGQPREANKHGWGKHSRCVDRVKPPEKGMGEDWARTTAMIMPATGSHTYK